MRWKVAFPILLGGSLFAILAIATPFAKAQQTRRLPLERATVVQGYPCARGNAWFYVDGSLNRCTIARGLVVGEVRIPAGSVIQLSPDGSPQFTLMSHDMPAAGVHCQGGSLLGPAEGSMVGFYPSGRFKYCFLTVDQAVQGVPCAAGGFWRAIAGHDVPVEFYEDGKLKSCGLAADFKGKHRFDRIVVPD